MLTHPHSRFTAFSCLYDLDRLSWELSDPHVPWRWLDIGEWFNVINDMVIDDPYAAIGSVLFDEEEAAAFVRLLEVPFDEKRLQGDREAVEGYLRSPEFRVVFERVADCLGAMFQPGRGLPGWDQGEIPWVRSPTLQG